MIALALKALGLMRVSEHEAVEQDRDDWRNKSMEQSCEAHDLRVARDDWEAKFKRAATDLAALAGELSRVRQTNERLASAIAEQEALRPDAQKWRDYLKRSRDRKAGKKA